MSSAASTTGTSASGARSTGKHPAAAQPAGDDTLVFLERGWLSSNNILLRGEPDEGALLIDAGHVRHAAQTVALVDHALSGLPLRRLVNTHLHSDHCGGNAALQATFDHARGGLHTRVPPGHAEAARQWDEGQLTYRPTGQRCPRFRVDGVIAPGEVLASGRWRFEAMAAPGHDHHALLFFDAGSGTLISADALWEDGFGVVFPELDGEPGFDEVEATLDLIARLPVREVLPGHGRRFGAGSSEASSNVADALVRARRRLAGHRASPAGHARHAAKVLIKYHLMEQGLQPVGDLDAWLAGTPMLAACQARAGVAGAALDFGRTLRDELISRGALRLVDGIVHDA